MVRDFAKFSEIKKINLEYETTSLQEYGNNVFYLTPQKKKISLSKGSLCYSTSTQVTQVIPSTFSIILQASNNIFDQTAGY